MLLDDGTITLSESLINNAGYHTGPEYQYLLTAYHGIQHYISELSRYSVLFKLETNNFLDNFLVLDL